jgi:hypothetical protein
MTKPYIVLICQHENMQLVITSTADIKLAQAAIKTLEKREEAAGK